ncbi:hypothetical protein [uncultured Draconibacterium sp.]|uniref:hypothetical protein n=1 Tax=uncultured Draconibacterium sp. TaxID=1573823 RepID=UPI0029C662F4|nr:hypothetical protein [uncultured Draconibacterium sp.]
MDKEVEKNYNYWRDVQRKQLGISANLFLLFATATLGYIIDLLIKKEIEIKCSEKTILIIGISFLIISLLFYSIFTLNRLFDFRKTAQLYRNGNSTKEVNELTQKNGQYTWYLFYGQVLFVGLAFIMCLVGLGMIIF